MTDLDITADTARFTAAGLTRTLASGPDLGPGYRRAAASTLRDLEERARTATRHETATRGWGATFVTSQHLTTQGVSRQMSLPAATLRHPPSEPCSIRRASPDSGYPA